MKCSKCGKSISSGTRYIKGKSGGKYHVACASNIADKSYAWTKKRKR